MVRRCSETALRLTSGHLRIAPNPRQLGCELGYGGHATDGTTIVPTPLCTLRRFFDWTKTHRLVQTGPSARSLTARTTPYRHGSPRPDGRANGSTTPPPSAAPPAATSAAAGPPSPTARSAMPKDSSAPVNQQLAQGAYPTSPFSRSLSHSSHSYTGESNVRRFTITTARR